MRGLTKAQLAALKKIERRDWSAGEPRCGWFGQATLTVLRRRELVVQWHDPARPGSRHDIVKLTPAGRAALSEGGGE